MQQAVVIEQQVPLPSTRTSLEPEAGEGIPMIVNWLCRPPNRHRTARDRIDL
jgi:hypothetical protein